MNSNALSERKRLLHRTTPVANDRWVDTGKGEVIILLSGLFEEISDWNAVVSTLASGYRVIVPRIPVFNVPAEHANLDQIIFFLEEFVARERLDQFTLIGHSLGGQLAALYTLWNPGQVKKLVLIASLGLDELPVYRTYPGVRSHAYVSEQVDTLFFGKQIERNKIVDDIFKHISVAGSALNVVALLRSSRRHRLMPLLDRIYVPTLLVWGLQDTITPPEVALQFHERLPRAEVHFIDQCGHAPMTEQPAQCAHQLESFLNKSRLAHKWN